MGRQYFLHRMALGRSAYEPGDAIPPTTNDKKLPASGHYIQQYDSRGNPFNADTSTTNKDLRNAQNEALLLTGIVERKDKSDKLARSASRSRDQSLLVEEQECGELLDYLLLPISFFSHLWLNAFIRRIQIGAYPPSLPLLAVLTAETRAIFQPGQPLKLSLAKRFPGLGDILSLFLLRMPLIITVEQVTGRLQTYIQNKRFTRKTTRKLYTAISMVFEATLILIDLALLPLDFYTTAQTLSLVPALPLLPSWSFFWGPHSFHSFGWSSTTSFLSTSPAVLLTFSRLLKTETVAEEFPISSLFTCFRWPTLQSNHRRIPCPSILRDPLGWTMYQCWKTRTGLLRWMGWRTVHISGPNDVENDIFMLNENDDVSIPHRSTELAYLPAQFLAHAIDAMFRKIAFLPFESLVLRSVAFASTGSSRQGRYYAPLGGPLSRVGKPGGLAEVGVYASRLGLGIMLNASVDVVLYFGVWGIVRRLGKARFGWEGRKMLEDVEHSEHSGGELMRRN